MTTLPVNDPYLRPPGATGPNPWFIRLPILFITGSVLLIAALIAMIAMFRVTYNGKITPGVSAYGVDLSGMTRDEALVALSGNFTYDQDATFTFAEGEHQWTLTAGELGVAFDATATVDQAMRVGADGDVFGGLKDQALTWLNGESVAPIIRYDQTAAAQQLVAIANVINQEAQDAQLIIDGTNVITTPSQIGRVVDINATLAQLDARITSLASGGEVPLVIMEQAPTVWNADEAANQVRAALSGPLQLVADGQNGETLGPWTASVEQIASLLTTNLVDNDDGTQRYEVSIDMGAFAGFLDTLAPGLLAPPRDGRFHFNTQTGQLEIIQPSVDGRELNVDETLNRLQQAVFRYDTRSVPVAFNYTQPRYNNGVTAAELGITQLVSEGTTYYTGSGVNRRHNIAEGASRFDGIIIGPGEEFSFNYWVGDISEESGFAEGKVIVGGRTVAGVGGGICQVSTTVFRAAFAGGFTIIERNSHAYRVGYYEISNAPGLDAAIWSPERDFRFQNDTPYHLLIETSVFPANNSLQFRFYSTNPGRRIEIDQPIIRDVVPAKETLYEVNPNFTLGQIEQVDYAAEGADITVYRRIYDLGGNLVKEDSIYTHYLPWQAVYDVAPGDSRLS